MKIELRHGSGGEETGRLIHGIFEKYFSNILMILFFLTMFTPHH